MVNKIILFFLFLMPTLSFAQREPASERERSERQSSGRERHDHDPNFERIRHENNAPRGSVIIKNSTEVDLSFNVQIDNNSWSVATVRHGYVSTWENITGMTINISTQNSNTVEYFLKPSYSYSLGWNSSKNCWDIYRDP